MKFGTKINSKGFSLPFSTAMSSATKWTLVALSLTNQSYHDRPPFPPITAFQTRSRVPLLPSKIHSYISLSTVLDYPKRRDRRQPSPSIAADQTQLRLPSPSSIPEEPLPSSKKLSVLRVSVVYDVTNQESLINVKQWLNKVGRYASENEQASISLAFV
ncbi:hypothetical protein L484_027183 [Morus notabilis]|uniref:Uncharacterized protein n=1 Tax=Morus notabilis TaxID=981085 RepID=W9SBR4_9ROSA|nr:hypothetical protein L484_027183 [Morus notabilis]